jgi:hypothetical protein
MAITRFTQRAYKELIEIAARFIAFTEITSVQLPNLVTTLQVKAADLRNVGTVSTRRPAPTK